MNRILIAATVTNLCAMVVAQFGTVAENDPNRLTWPDQPADRKEAILRAVDMVLQNPDVTPEENHAGWVAQQLAAGWTAGEHDAEKKTHPHLVPWAELPVETRIRDSLLPAVVRELKNHPDAPAGGSMDMLRVASAPRIMAAPGSNVAVKYIGVRESYKDPVGSGLVFAKGETKWVEASIAAKMFAHPSVYVPGNPEDLAHTLQPQQPPTDPKLDDLAEQQARQDAIDQVNQMDKNAVEAYVKTNFNIDLDKRGTVAKLRGEAVNLIERFGLPATGKGG